MGLGVLKILDAVNTLSVGIKSKIKFYQAGTSELYGKVLETPQNEKTPFNPVSPYAAAKLYAYHMVKIYREGYGIHATNGILFNHESPRRGANFVTMKIVNGIKDIVSGKKEHIILGNLDSKRDWGHAKDYVKGMWLMLQQEISNDYVLATGKHTRLEVLWKKLLNTKDMISNGKGKVWMKLEWTKMGSLESR